MISWLRHYTWLEGTLTKDVSDRFSVIPEDIPDPHAARESYWVPFTSQTLKVDEKTILIGHSSGCAAILRLLEEDKVRGVVLVAAGRTDLDDVCMYVLRPITFQCRVRQQKENAQHTQKRKEIDREKRNINNINK